MSDIKRYCIDVEYYGLDIEEDSGGPWVKYENVEERIAELEAKNAYLLLKLTEALKKVADLNARQEEKDDGLDKP